MKCCRDLSKKKKMKTINRKMTIKNYQQLNLKKQKQKRTKQTTRNRIIDMEIIWRVIRGEGEGGEWKQRYRD